MVQSWCRVGAGVWCRVGAELVQEFGAELVQSWCKVGSGANKVNSLLLTAMTLRRDKVVLAAYERVTLTSC